jgi:hypothetical protein
MISSYGLHWKADRVNWGKPGIGNPGTLLGATSRSLKAHPVDFREQRGIYALYAGYELVYVGQTGAGDDRLFKRLKEHRHDHLSERWDRFSWFGTQRKTKKNLLSADTKSIKNQSVKAALDIMEAVAIAISEPKLNLQRGHWNNSTKFFQYGIRDKEENEED